MSLLRSFMDEDGGFFRDPFGMDRGGPRGNALMPFGMGGMFGGGIFGQMNQMMQQMERQMSQVNQMMVNPQVMNPGPNRACFVSSTSYSMTSDGSGRPQVYHEAQSTRVGPGGVRETRRLMEDSRRGLRQTAVGHHIGEKGRVIEKDMDLQANTTEEREDLINLSEGEADDFERDWEQRASGYLAGRRGGPVIQAIEDEDHIPQRQAPLAIGYHASTSQAPQVAPVVTHPPHQRRDRHHRKTGKRGISGGAVGGATGSRDDHHHHNSHHHASTSSRIHTQAGGVREARRLQSSGSRHGHGHGERRQRGAMGQAHHGLTDSRSHNQHHAQGLRHHGGCSPSAGGRQ